MNNLDENQTASVPEQPKKNRRAFVGGLVLIVLGLIFLIQNYIPGLDMSKLWPIVLIVIGLSLAWDGFRK